MVKQESTLPVVKRKASLNISDGPQLFDGVSRKPETENNNMI